MLDILVLNNRIEQTVLVGSRREGDEISKNGYPDRCRGVYTPDCYSMGHHLGGLSTQTLNVWKKGARMDTDTSARLMYDYTRFILLLVMRRKRMRS